MQIKVLAKTDYINMWHLPPLEHLVIFFTGSLQLIIKVKKSQQVDPRLSYLDEDFYGIAALVGYLASFHFGTEKGGELKKHPISKSSQP